MRAVIAIFCVIFAFLLTDFIWSENRNRVTVEAPLTVPFDHSLHGDSIGMDCAACHAGARTAGHAFLPSKRDCMDCHRLPLTENPGIETLDSVLALASDKPWASRSILPQHVVFHHGVHSAAGIGCEVCHGSQRMNYGSAVVKDSSEKSAAETQIYTGLKFDMQTCIQCHRGELFKDKHLKHAATYCAACHR